ncbi:MAG: class II fructose-bisphosphate aldolase [Parvibaculales bacterium]
MALITLRQLLDHAAQCGYGMPAFNVSNMETVLAIMSAADKTDSPVILQASRSARSYASDVMLAHIFAAAMEKYPHIPICIHQDHGNNLETCQSAIANGFSSVMMDGSLEEDAKTPASYEYNAAITAKVVALAHAGGVSVEGELGCLGSLETGEGEKEDGHGFEGTLSKDMLVTSPLEARQFVADTEVDALAIAIGTSHGAYKFSKKPESDILAMETLKEIHAALPHTHLVMHGASSVSQEVQDAINQNGGMIAQTFGMPLEEIETGIKNGVRKVNIDTDIRMASTAAIRQYFSEKPESFDVRAFMTKTMQATETLCTERFERFGSAGQAAKIKPIALSEMAKQYKDNKSNASQ